MAYNYISAEERKHLNQKQAIIKARDKVVQEGNFALVGEIKEYKGVKYRMTQMGTYKCIDLPEGSDLAGTFTSTSALHELIDKREKES